MTQTGYERGFNLVITVSYKTVYVLLSRGSQVRIL